MVTSEEGKALQRQAWKEILDALEIHIPRENEVFAQLMNPRDIHGKASA